MSADPQLQGKEQLFLQEGFLVPCRLPSMPKPHHISSKCLLVVTGVAAAAAEAQVGLSGCCSLPEQQNVLFCNSKGLDSKSDVFPLMRCSQQRPPPSFCDTSSMEH